MRLIDADEILRKCNWGNCWYIPREAIEEEPTIDAEPVKPGKWVRLEIKDIINPLTGKNRTYTGCSCCGEPIPTDSILDIIPEEEVNFCFACGAKMGKE